MKLFAFEDRLELLGVLTGALLVVMGLGSLLNPPFLTTEFTGAAIVQTIGILLLFVIGLLLIAISRPDGLPFLGDENDTVEEP